MMQFRLSSNTAGSWKWSSLRIASNSSLICCYSKTSFSDSLLVAAELLFPRESPPQAIYVFKHALIQDAAYQSLLRRTRQQYHQRIAQALAERFPETGETQPAVLAQHYTEAGLGALALGYWQQVALGAPLMAIKGYSAPEVGQAYARARQLCQQIGDTPQLFPVLYGLSVFYAVGTDLQTSRELGLQCLRLAQRVQDQGLILEAYAAL